MIKSTLESWLGKQLEGRERGFLPVGEAREESLVVFDWARLPRINSHCPSKGVFIYLF